MQKRRRKQRERKTEREREREIQRERKTEKDIDQGNNYSQTARMRWGEKKGKGEKRS